ncbi:MAG: GGDEF domain-containing protein [Coriobacteriia bacterium]|nr:GGDEF domain-containing protein [Coriobacteriia bacterium]
MKMTATAEIVRLCREIDETARDVYAKLSRVPCPEELSRFWAHMSEEEAEHIRFWERAEHAGDLTTIPDLVEDADEVIAELERTLVRSRELLDLIGEDCDVAASFTLAYRMEFYLLHPAFELLFRLLGPSAGDPNPADEYECHISEFIDMLRSYGSVTPELELLGETIQRLWRENKRLAASSARDDLTAVLDRRGFFALSTQLAHLAARTGSTLGVMMIDIDHFKSINDQHGHVTGDRVLRDIAGLLSSRLRASDTVGRYGGDEFVVLALPVIHGGTWAIAEAIRKAVEEASTHDIATTVSIGIAEAELGSDIQADFLRLIERADLALYEAKRNGRNRVSQHKPVLD